MSYDTTLELDASGNVTITELSTLGMVTGIEKVKQDLTVLLKTVKGEHPENPDFSVDRLRISHSAPFQAMADIPVIPAALTQGSRAKSKSALSMSLMAPPPAHCTAPR